MNNIKYIGINVHQATSVFAVSRREGRAVAEASVGYSIGLWHLLSGRSAQARAYFEKAIASKYSVAWGYRASEADLKRLR